MRRFTIVLVFLSAVVLYGQIDQSYFSVLGTFAIPLDDFTDDDNYDNDGYATCGFGGGFQYCLPLWHPSFALTTEVLFMVNFLDKEEFEEDAVFFNLRVEDVKGGNYFSLPVLFGLKIFIPIVSQFGFYATGQMGLNVLMESELNGELGPEEGTLNFDPDVTFAVGVGAGIVIDEKVTIGIRYLSLGEPKIDYEVQWAGFEGEDEREFKVAVFEFLIGYKF